MEPDGQILAGQSAIPGLEFEPWQTAGDPGGRVEPTSQAEYAGSIPIIGSDLTSVNATKRGSAARSVSLPYPDLPTLWPCVSG
jgi:hypothetical protein